MLFNNHGVCEGHISNYSGNLCCPANSNAAGDGRISMSQHSDGVAHVFLRFIHRTRWGCVRIEAVMPKGPPSK
jgi:hypothetical protein